MPKHRNESKPRSVLDRLVDRADEPESEATRIYVLAWPNLVVRQDHAVVDLGIASDIDDAYAEVQLSLEESRQLRDLPPVEREVTMPNTPHNVVYIAGPMTGIKDFNYPAFFAAEEVLLEAGWATLNPARNDGETLNVAVKVATKSNLPRADYMRRDFSMLLEADAIAFLPGWQKSQGARAESVVAEQLNLPRLDALTGEPLREEAITEEAYRIVLGDRGADYGPPTEDFTRTGRMWGAILGIPDIPPEKVGLCMTALKISREINKPKRDNRVDMIGYTLTVDMIEAARA